MNEVSVTQKAVQLVGPDELRCNHEKEVFRPGPYQILGKVEACGLCFSDLKLLKQFSGHVRKSDVLKGVDPKVLSDTPSYVPGDLPTVPGHEVIIRIVEIGDKVKNHQVGERCLVQTDYRWLPTANSNAALGYNFEGGLQEYVLMDERVITSPEGQSYLLPTREDLSAASISLVEPWACVEDAYAVHERAQLCSGGDMLVVADERVDPDKLNRLFEQYGRPQSLRWAGHIPDGLNVSAQSITLDDLGEDEYNDVIYYGSNPEVVERLFKHVKTSGLYNIVLCGGQLGRDVTSYVGRVHYGNIRIIGTTGNDPAEAMKSIPKTGEIRTGDIVDVIGAGGPMGVMHVVRDLCQGVNSITVCAGDLDDQRLQLLDKIAQPLAEKNGLIYRSYNPKKEGGPEKATYIVLMAPVPALVANAVKKGGAKAIINIFAGIPASVTAQIDMQRYIERGMYFIGTSGSNLDDMKTVLSKVEAGTLDTNISVAAVSDLDGAIEGIRAVEKQLIPGKILVYPACKGLGLMTLADLIKKHPEIAGLIPDGIWNREAEKVLMKLYS